MAIFKKLEISEKLTNEWHSRMNALKMLKTAVF